MEEEKLGSSHSCTGNNGWPRDTGVFAFVYRLSRAVCFLLGSFVAGPVSLASLLSARVIGTLAARSARDAVALGLRFHNGKRAQRRTPLTRMRDGRLPSEIFICSPRER